MPAKKDNNVSVYRDVKNSVVNLVDFIKTTTEQNLVEASRNDMIKIEEGQLQAVVELVNSSITQGMTTGFREIESLISNVDNKLSSSSSSKNSKKK